MTFWEIRNISEVIEQSHLKLYMYPLALNQQIFERFNGIISKIYMILNKSLCSVTYTVELFTHQTNPNISRPEVRYARAVKTNRYNFKSSFNKRCFHFIYPFKKAWFPYASHRNSLRCKWTNLGYVRLWNSAQIRVLESRRVLHNVYLILIGVKFRSIWDEFWLGVQSSRYPIRIHPILI